MFNLTAFEGTNIVVKTLDDFYNDGSTYDLTKYVGHQGRGRSKLYSVIFLILPRPQPF